MRWFWILGFAAIGATGCYVEEAPADDDDGGENNAPAAEQLEGPSGCMVHSECPEGTLCQFEATTCGQVGGTCQPANGVDPNLSACPVTGPVCGCDGVTYQSACAAWDFGVSTWFEGTCEQGPPPQEQPQAATSCGGGCGGGDFCFFADNACGASGGGECRNPNGVCTSPQSPVCGCDGQTYASECDAVRASTSVAWDGPC